MTALVQRAVGSGRPKRVAAGFVLLFAAGCAQTVQQCLRPAVTDFSELESGLEMPDGCSLDSVDETGIAVLDCEDGRTGFMLTGG